MKHSNRILRIGAIAFSVVLVLSLASYLMESRSDEEQQTENNDIEESWDIVPVDIQGAPFSLVSIKEYVKSDVEHRVAYRVRGNKIVPA